MQLSNTSIERIQQLITVAKLIDIDNVIIEDGRIRGIREDKSIVMFADKDIPDFGFPRVGLNRLSALASRLQLAKSADTLVIDSKKGKNDDEVGMLDISWKGAKIQYRCAAPDLIRVPKNIRDTDSWSVTVGSAQLEVISNAMKSLKATKINLNTRTGSEVFMELVEVTSNDTFTLQVADGAEYLKEGTPKSKVWVNVYPAQQLISVLRAAAEGKDAVQFIIGENGTLQVMVNDTYRLIVVSLIDTE